MRYARVMKTEIKAEVLRLVDRLPEDATWADLEYAMYVRQSVEAGLDDLEAGRTLTSEEVRKRFGLSARS